MTKPYRVTVRVHNNLLLQAIEDAGYESQAAFARELGVGNGVVSALVGMRRAPIGPSGSFTALARRVMETLCLSPTDLWTEEQLTMALPRNTSCREVDAETFLQLPEEEISIERKIFSEQVRQLALSGKWNKGEMKVLLTRLGLGPNELTLEQVGDTLSLSRERARQIEAKVMQKLKKRLSDLREFM
jgi:hypothetical protein